MMATQYNMTGGQKYCMAQWHCSTQWEVSSGTS